MSNSMNQKKDFLKPKFHYTAPKNWINDPNGFSFYKGSYHLFYQYNPKGLDWGNMSWGHAISNDMVSWTTLPVAMVPDKYYDVDGVFSGSAIVVNEEHILYYTGVCHEPKGLKQVQCKAVSTDGIQYTKIENNPILEGEIHEDPYDFRDPKVWIDHNKYYMIAATTENNKGKANIYVSKDGESFEFLSSISKSNTGRMWECPDLFHVNSQWLVMFSAMEVGHNNGQNLSYIGLLDFEYSKIKNEVNDYYLMDLGTDFYAPQSIEDEKGRRVVIGWLRMAKPLNENENWTGMMTLPREILYGDNKITYKVIDEIFDNKEVLISKKEHSLSKEVIFLGHDKAYELNLEIGNDTNVSIGDIQKYGFNVKYHTETKTVELKRKLSGELDSFVTPRLNDESIKMQIIIDKSVIEVFINNGEYVISAVFDGNVSALEIETSKSPLYFEFADLGDFK